MTGCAPRRRGSRPTGERGAVAGIEALAFGTLVFVVGTLLVANVWAAVDGRSAADGAARAASRAVVVAVARDAALAALAAHGVDPGRPVTVEVGGDLVRCGVIEVTVAHRVPLVLLPSVGQDRPAVTVTARHAAVVDPFASGLPAAPGVPCG